MPKGSTTRFSPQRPSPHTYSPVFTSTPRTNGSESPSSQSLRESRYNGLPSYRNSVDSPSYHLLEEFSRMMIDKDREFYAALDKASQEQEKAHQEALAAAAFEHEKVRKTAEIARERHELELLKERRRRDEDEQRNLERVRKENEEAEHQRKLLQLQRQEEESRKAAQKAKELADAQSRIGAEKEKQASEEARRKEEKAELDRKTQEAAAEASRQATAKATVPPTANTTSIAAAAATTPARPVPTSHSDAPSPQPEVHSALVTSKSERETTHKQYLEIHQRLKELRKQVMALGKQNKAIGDVRRRLKSRVGQITTDSKSNTETRKHIVEILAQSIQDQGGQPQVDVRQYVSSSSAISTEQAPCNMPALLVYYLHMFCKFVCKQLCTEVGTQSNMAEPIMIQVAFIFSDPNLFWNGSSLIDILLAKFHKACPVLFGIYGNEATAQGRARLGWQQINGSSVPEAEHRRRIEGLASGFAGLSLRNFSKTTRKNPVPNTEYWRAMACIVNTPEQDITKTHLIVLRNLIEKYAERFIAIYGQMAVVAMRHATIEFPKKAAARFPTESKEVSFLPDIFKRDLRLSI